MKSGSNYNRMAAARALRDSYVDIVRKLAGQGKRAQAIGNAIGRSHCFVQRVIRENGIAVDEYRPKPPQRPAKQAITVPAIGYARIGRDMVHVSVPKAPWGEFDRGPRHETAPRGNSHMYSSPVTRAEQMARELWREAGV